MAENIQLTVSHRWGASRRRGAFFVGIPGLAKHRKSGNVPRVLRLIACSAVPLLCCQCTLFVPAPQPPVLPKEPAYHVHQDRYAALKPSSARIRIDLGEQKARLLNRHDEVVLETDISTGKPGNETPSGTFRISEKIVDKRSNLYGNYLDKKTGTVLGKSWEVVKPPKGAIYEGFSMKYWMRLTNDGVGMHVGYVKVNDPSSFGCIRVPEAIQPLIYEKCLVGTKVMIDPAPPKAEIVETDPPPPRRRSLFQ